MKRIAKLFAASLLLAWSGAAGAPAEDVGGTVMPYSLNAFDGDVDAIADMLREVKRRGGISRFVMSGPGHKVRVNGMMDVAGYAALGRRIGELRRKVFGKPCRQVFFHLFQKLLIIHLTSSFA